MTDPSQRDPGDHEDVCPFPLVPAGELRNGDLVHLGGITYVLVAYVHPVDDLCVDVGFYDDDHPQAEAHRHRRGDDMRVAHRGVRPPLTPAGAAAHARRRDAAIAAMDRIRGRGGRVNVDEEIDRIRGPWPGLPEPIVQPAAGTTIDLPGVLAGHRADGPLFLDVDQPAVRAIIALFDELTHADRDDGGWDTVDIVRCWFDRIGVHPGRGTDSIDPR